MGRRRLPALLALVAGLLLGAGAGAPGVVAYGLHGISAGAPTSATAAGSGTVRASGHDAVVLASTPRPAGTAVHRADRPGPAGRGLPRGGALAAALALLAVALAAFVGRQRRRSRPPTWHRATLLGRGPPLLLAS